jgi:glycosyltransferase involved in cell wall biosynthesis
MLSSLSVFLPCFNEEKNIARVISNGLALLPKVAKQFEIVVIDDGSWDKTAKAVKSFTDPRVRLVHHEKNLGYGMALRTGIAASTHEWTFWTDGDGQFDFIQLQDFVPFTSKYEAIIGYRKNRAEGFRRALNTKLYNTVINAVFGLHIKDYDCAFKLIRSKELQALHLRSTGAFTSAEILYQLVSAGIKIKELPVSHLPRLHGTPTGNNVKVILRAVKEAAAIRLTRQIPQ